MLTGHGNDIYQFDNEIVVDFSTNIAKTHIREKLLIFLQKKLKCINNYPDPENLQLKKTIAKFHNVLTDEVIVTNGSTEAFYLIAQTFTKKKTFIKIPSFSEYEDACLRFGHDLVHEHEVNTENIKAFDMVWLGNPNNPDGKVIPVKQIEEWCTAYPNTMFVIDEAYADLSPICKTAIPLVNKKMNIIVIRSLTKSFSIPGLRLGYIIAKKDIAEKIKKNIIPWNVNCLAIEAGIFIMNNYDSLVPDANELLDACRLFIDEMQKVNGIKVIASNANFFLSELKRGTAAELKQYLIKNHGLLIRDASNFKGLTPQHFRVSVRSIQQNQLLVNAIQSWMNR